MSREKDVVPYKVQKGNRPKIEDVIAYCLDGDLRIAASEFTAYMRDNKMPFKVSVSTTISQRTDYKGEPICNIMVYGETGWEHVDRHNQGDLAYWTVTPL